MTDAARLTDEHDDPHTVLEELRALRTGARTDRHAYWLPLLVFGLVVCASAPLYVRQPASTDDGGEVYLPWATFVAGLGGLPVPGQPSAEVRGWYWVLGLGLGAMITWAWYAWHARVTGVATRVRGSLVAIAVAVGALVALSSALPLFFLLWPLTVRGTAGLLVVLAGLAVLSRQERSRWLAVVTLVFGVVACLGVFYDPQNILYRVLRGLGVEDGAMPFETAGVVNVLVPGLLLLGAGFAALAVDLRRR